MFRLKNIKIKLKRGKEEQSFPDFEAFHNDIISKVQPYTMTSPERLYGLIEAVTYIHIHDIEGDVVECGVWKGGSMMTIALLLDKYKNYTKELYLYDTFEGMSEPTDNDIDVYGKKAKISLDVNKNKEENIVWAYSSLEEVKNNIFTINYPKNKIHFVAGKVEHTIPTTIPEKIALLRLDTDWYESTKHEMIHLFPRLVKGGVLIIDDFGHWAGAKKAVKEYLQENRIKILLNRMDETGRIAIKQ